MQQTLTLFDYFHILFFISLAIHMIHAVFKACYSDRALAISLGRGWALFRDGHFNVLTSDSPNVCCLSPLTGEPLAHENKRILQNTPSLLNENKQDGGNGTKQCGNDWDLKQGTLQRLS